MLVVRALLLLLLYDLFIRFCGFREIHAIVRRWKTSTNSPNQETVTRVCNAVDYACIWYPKQILCLQRSFVTTRLLRKNGVPAQMILGAQKMPFKAHAWVEVSGSPVNERSNVQAIYHVWERC
jgi:hypothetical protein